MSVLRIISGLQKSTKITLIACGSFLALTTLILIFLMIFPIEPEQQAALENGTVQTTAVPAETQSVSEEWQNTEAPHTLSEWTASVEHFSRSTDEYYEYLRSTTEAGAQSTEPEYEETEASHTAESTDEWQETGTSVWDETGVSGAESSEYVHSETQTVTETVVIPTETGETPTEEPQQPETDPPQTDPPIVDEPVEEQGLPVLSAFLQRFLW